MIERLILLAPPRSPDQAITSTYPLLALYFPLLTERIELIGAACNGKYIAGNEKYRAIRYSLCPVQPYLLLRAAPCSSIFVTRAAPEFY